MHISPGTVLLVNLALAALEVSVAASSLSDDEFQRRIRGSSDLGTGSDQEPRSSNSSNSGGNPPPQYSLSRMIQSYSPPSSSLPTSLPLHVPRHINAPYYREYLNQLPLSGLTPPIAISSSARLLRNEDALDTDTSMSLTSQMFSYHVPQSQFTPTTSEIMAMAMGNGNSNESFRFDHVSNAAFVYDGSAGGVSRASSSVRTSPMSNDRDSSNLAEGTAISDQARAVVTKALEQDTGKANELENEDEELLKTELAELTAPLKPSYKQVLEKKIKSSSSNRSYKEKSPFIPSAELENESKKAAPAPKKSIIEKMDEMRKADKKARPLLLGSIQDLELKPTGRAKLAAQPGFLKEAEMRFPSETIAYTVQTAPNAHSQQQSQSTTPINSRRPMVTPGEVFNALSPAVSTIANSIANSNTNTNANGNSNGNVMTAEPNTLNAAVESSFVGMRERRRDDRVPMTTIGSALDESLNSNTERDQPQQQPQSNSRSNITPLMKHNFVPSYLHTFFQWGNMFRMPKHAAPPTAMNPNRFQFPRNEHTSKRFLKQLKQFRKSLKYHMGKRISHVSFEDFEPNLNYVGERPGEEVDKSDPKRARKYSLTDSQPIKVFNSPPTRTWIPVRCDALGFDFKVLEAGIGHAGKAGGKAQVSIVYDANKEARRDPSNTSEPERVKYISKEYYDMEYFLNEYNFLQFAHLPYIPKPFCVEYGPNPKIVMEHIPGERVHYTFYRYGQYLRQKYPNPIDKELREEKMQTMLAKVLAKILVTVKYIHSIGFIHADIKPENIMYDITSGRVVMIDFDLSVSAPYVFTGRGTETTIAPELNGLLQGPVHFGIDWWAYGSTVAMIISAGYAGIFFDANREEAKIEKYFNYVPFKYIRGLNRYEMTPIPEFFPPAMRSFLYPFFNPDPSLRVFSEHNAYNWIRSHPIFSVISDWSRYENLDLGPYSVATPMHIGFIAFSQRPVLLLPITRLHKFINGISNMFYLGNVFSEASATTKDGTLANVEDSGDEDGDEDSEEYSDDEEEEIFKFEE